MSIISTFDADREAILNPWNAVAPVEGLPDTVLVVFSAKFLALLGEIVSLEEIAVLKGGGRAYPVYRFEYEGHTLGAYHSMTGGAAAAAMLEEIIAMGAKRLLCFGSAGALDRDITAGKLIVPTHAYRDEGVSYHYLPEADFVNIPTADRLAEIFGEIGVSHLLTKTWTTDAPYRETRANVEARRAQGCSVVEMECASLMAVAAFRNIPVYQFLYAADCLDAAQWDKRLLGNMPADLRGRILKVALEAAIRI